MEARRMRACVTTLGPNSIPGLNATGLPDAGAARAYRVTLQHKWRAKMIFGDMFFGVNTTFSPLGTALACAPIFPLVEAEGHQYIRRYRYRR